MTPHGTPIEPWATRTGDANPTRPTDWSQAVEIYTELAAVPGMTISRLLRLAEQSLVAGQFTGDKNEIQRDTALAQRWRS